MSISNPACPACGTPVANGQSVCENCGFHPVLRKGKSIRLDALKRLTQATRAAATMAAAEASEAQTAESAVAVASPPEARVEEARPPLVIPQPTVVDGLALRLVSGLVSSAGVKRHDSPNEDSGLVVEICNSLVSHPQWLGLYAVADGMGGHDAGEVASRLALEALSSSIMHTVGEPWVQGQRLPPEEVVTRFNTAVENAHQKVLAGEHQPGSRRMGTTLTAVLIVDGLVYVSNTGDSRTYLFHRRNETLERVSHDQSLVQQLVDSGEITEEDVYTDPRRHIILSSLGAETPVSGAQMTIQLLEPGDRLLLCSDGLWEMVRDPEIARILREVADPQDAAEDMVDRACETGGLDNVTALVVEVQERRQL